jgi:hypothetical protein
MDGLQLRLLLATVLHMPPWQVSLPSQMVVLSQGVFSGMLVTAEHTPAAQVLAL